MFPPCAYSIFLIVLHFTQIGGLNYSEQNIVTYSNLRRPLENVPLKCCAVDAAPFVWKAPQRKPQFDGWSMDNFIKLQQRAGFYCESLAEFKLKDKNEYKTSYNDLVDYMSACTGDDCLCDIGIGSWWRSKEREGVHFLPPHGYDSFVVVTPSRNTKSLNDRAFFLSSFGKFVWVAIVGLWFSFLILKLFDRRFAPTTDVSIPQIPPEFVYTKFKMKILKTPMLYRFRKAFQSIIEKLHGRPKVQITGEENSTRQWFLNFTIVVSGLIITIVYEAAMTDIEFQHDYDLVNLKRTKLAQISVTSDFESLEDLRNCNIRFEEICFRKGDFTEIFWDNLVRNSVFKKANQWFYNFKIAMDKWISTYQRTCTGVGSNMAQKCETTRDTMENLLNLDNDNYKKCNTTEDSIGGENATQNEPTTESTIPCEYMISDGGSASFSVKSKYCSNEVSTRLEITGNQFFSWGVSFIARKGLRLEYIQKLKDVSLSLIEESAFEPLEEYVSRRSKCSPTQKSTIPLDSLVFFFVLAGGVCILLLIYMLSDRKHVNEGETVGSGS